MLFAFAVMHGDLRGRFQITRRLGFGAQRLNRFHDVFRLVVVDPKRTKQEVALSIT